MPFKNIKTAADLQAEAAQKAIDDAIAADVAYIRNGVELIGKLQVQLIDKLLADNIISAQDFTPNVRQQYQTLKAAVDRLAD
jgi:hypothetical protein